MTEPWSADEAPVSQGMPGGTVTLVEGSTFCISDPGGDIRPGHALGLFVRDTRVLSRWELAVDGRAPQPLTVQQAGPYAAAFVARLPPPAGLADSTLLVVRHRYVGDGMREDITIRNSAALPATCVVTVTADADFADLFEVKDGQARPQAAASTSAGDSTLRFASRRGERHHGLLIRGDGRPSAAEGVLRWYVTVPARGQWTASVEAVPVTDGVPMTLCHPRGQAVEHAMPAHRLREWRRSAPQVRTADRDLAAVLHRSIEDLGALRIFDPAHPGRPVVAAGAPWFMALFGRDSLLTSWMLLPWDAALAIGTLQTLAGRQGSAIDPASEEEPGRILHEVRFGPAATLALGGRSAYYGTADATSLFVMLLGELQRWGGHDAEVQALLPHADRALEWIEHYGDADGDGFVEYSRKTSRGLVNQGWKDSWDGINFADGRIAEPPIALAEVQGYTYAAYRARARFAREAGDAPGASSWDAKANRLRQAFNDAYWLPDRGWFAVALDREKRPVDSLTSNIGHCLWTGIVDPGKAALIAEQLLSDDMFSGWGIRTLAASMAAYNPMSYHNGSVWPHDNALCAAGLMRYGFTEQARRVTEAIFDAARHFGHRLPELFCGFSRTDYPVPVPYPTSCSPQAWAAAAPLQLLHSLLRFTPELSAGQAWCAPAIPERYLPLHLRNLRLGTSRMAIDVQDDGWELTGLDGAGIELIRAPRPPAHPHRAPGPSEDRPCP
ncbi:MAG TPA: glycogen debranching N-terminal domain-containing protein [Streptosporangiaceae bacterium]